MQATEESDEEDGESLEETTKWLIRQSMQAGDDEDEDVESSAEELLTDSEAADAQEPDVLAAEDSERMSQAIEAEESTRATDALELQEALHADSANGPELEHAEPMEPLSNYLMSDSDEEDGAVDSRMAAAAAADSWSWGRIIRHPRKRSKHIIFDVCTANASMPLHQRQNVDQVWAGSNTLQTDRLGDRKQEGHRGLGGEGALVRQVVASSDKQTWLGPAGYRLARKARWGDLWPAHYAQSSGLGGKGR